MTSKICLWTQKHVKQQIHLPLNKKDNQLEFSTKQRTLKPQADSKDFEWFCDYEVRLREVGGSVFMYKAEKKVVDSFNVGPPQL